MISTKQSQDTSTLKPCYLVSLLLSTTQQEYWEKYLHTLWKANILTGKYSALLCLHWISAKINLAISDTPSVCLISTNGHYPFHRDELRQLSSSSLGSINVAAIRPVITQPTVTASIKATGVAQARWITLTQTAVMKHLSQGALQTLEAWQMCTWQKYDETVSITRRSTICSATRHTCYTETVILETLKPNLHSGESAHIRNCIWF